MERVVPSRRVRRDDAGHADVAGPAVALDRGDDVGRVRERGRRLEEDEPLERPRRVVERIGRAHGARRRPTSPVRGEHGRPGEDLAPPRLPRRRSPSSVLHTTRWGPRRAARPRPARRGSPRATSGTPPTVRRFLPGTRLLPPRAGTRNKIRPLMGATPGGPPRSARLATPGSKCASRKAWRSSGRIAVVARKIKRRKELRRGLDRDRDTRVHVAEKIRRPRVRGKQVGRANRATASVSTVEWIPGARQRLQQARTDPVAAQPLIGGGANPPAAAVALDDAAIRPLSCSEGCSFITTWTRSTGLANSPLRTRSDSETVDRGAPHVADRTSSLSPSAGRRDVRPNRHHDPRRSARRGDEVEPRRASNPHLVAAVDASSR